ncbi:E3 ubiquitin-protein ligase SH3RF2 isoform X2 [Scleropages formosus]|uniref:E3 ubiquitin-protein ligase SH3RF2 isoform X2 n=1 Tax=Scleropages formosus TaxID=113540 RepID=UPI0010FAA3B2|nr:E3 ubiquitin-protein ligase SH3RF2-like isoform X2 [Scleropages formosus]
MGTHTSETFHYGPEHAEVCDLRAAWMEMPGTMKDLAVLDLLECPLCFEPLDVSARVLPCQHTFCKQCLLKLAASDAELHCPECRTPVTEPVEKLPANLLLEHLLEGLRRGPGGTVRHRTLRYRIPPGQHLSVRNKDTRYSTLRQTHSRRKHLDGVPWARALHNYKGNFPGELNIKSGDVIILRRKVDENWYHGEANGNSGLVPASMVQVVNELPKPLPLCRALYDFDMKDRGQEDTRDFLTFFKGDIISVIRCVDKNWVEGKLGQKVGIFPLQFTEPNSAALKLLGRRRPGGPLDSQARIAASGSGGTEGTVDAGGRRLASGVPSGPAVAPTTGTLSHVSQSAQGPLGERQPSSISGSTFLVSSSSAVAAQLSERRPDGLGSNTSQGPNSAPSEWRTSYESPPIITMALVNPQSLSGSSESKQSSTQQLSISVCAVLYSYAPRRPEELELRQGEMVGVYGRFREGWLRALSLKTGKVGILPANYVTPVLRFLDAKSAPAQSTMAGKGSMTCKSQAAAVAMDKAGANGTVRMGGQVPTVATTTAPVMPSASTSRATQLGSVRRTFHPPPRAPTLQGSLSSRVPPSSIVRPQPAPLSVGPVQSFAATPNTSKMRSTLLASSSRPPCWVHEATPPSTGGSLSLDLQEPVTKEVLEKQVNAGPQSILVKPDSYKNTSDKPIKSVRFLTQENPATGTRATSLPSEGHTGPSIEPGCTPEAWGSQSLLGSSGGDFKLSDNKTPAHKKGMIQNPVTAENLPPSHKTGLSSNLQSSSYRHRVSAADAHLKEGEPGVAHRPRQETWLPATQEKSGRTGLVRGSIPDVLEKLS